MSSNSNVIKLDSFRKKPKVLDVLYHIPSKIEFFYLHKSDELVVTGETFVFDESVKEKVNFTNKNKALLFMLNAFIDTTKKLYPYVLDQNGMIDYEKCKSVFYDSFNTVLNQDKERWSILFLSLTFTDGFNNDIFNLDFRTLTNTKVWLLSKEDLYKDNIDKERNSDNFSFISTYLVTEGIKHFTHLIKIEDNNN